MFEAIVLPTILSSSHQPQGFGNNVQKVCHGLPPLNIAERSLKKRVHLRNDRLPAGIKRGFTELLPMKVLMVPSGGFDEWGYPIMDGL